ncbi:MAG: hypothetical protein JSV88_20110 [Candidatus Aminicenantes bacterium]|nr:MAG: hypothetical protein JSV88_20110 [Candidatus Aminicenantes bacterium]
MNQTNSASVENILKAYSIDSDQGAEILFPAVLKLTWDDAPIKSEKLSRFLERFPAERPFGDILEEAISAHRTSIDRLSGDTSISRNLLDQVLNHLELPNIIPVKKMNVLLKILHIPLKLAVESMRASLNRLNVEKSLMPLSGLAAGRTRKRDLNFLSSERSREALKRRLEAYINRLSQEKR